MDALYKECIFTFIALPDKVETFGVSSEEGVDDFLFSFIFQFDNLDPLNGALDTRQQANKDLKERVVKFLNFYAEGFPKIKRLIAFFNHLPDNEPFIFSPFHQPDTIELGTYFNYLKSVKHGEDFEKLELENKELLGNLLVNYEFHMVGEQRKNFGEPDRNKRICRFCDNKSVPLSFDSKAHAISEALGNKTLVLYDECDVCNQNFSKNIEQDLIEYFSFFRTFYGIKGKGGNKNVKGENFTLIHQPDGKLNLTFISEDGKTEPSMPMNIPLLFKRKISLQNIYRTLCKYFLSVIATDQLVYFKDTIDWINGKRKYEKLPLVGRIMFVKVAEQPTMISYIRKTEDTSLPYAIAEFHFTIFKVCFIIPGVSKDDKDFTDKQDYERFRKNFKHYGEAEGWLFEDLSHDEKRGLQFNFNVEQRNK